MAFVATNPAIIAQNVLYILLDFDLFCVCFVGFSTLFTCEIYAIFEVLYKRSFVGFCVDFASFK